MSELISKILAFLLIFVSLCLTNTKLPVVPRFIGTSFSVLKEVLLFGALLMGFIAFLKKPMTVLFPSKYCVYVCLYTIWLIIYTAISPLGFFALAALLPMISAPVVFLSLLSINFSQRTSDHILKSIYYLLFANIAISLVIHLFFFDSFKYVLLINEYFTKTGIQVGNIVRYTSDGRAIPRLIGLSISPTETASIALFVFLFAPVVIRNNFLRLSIIVLSATVFYLTETRSSLIGFVFASGFFIYARLRTLNKAILLFPILAGVILASFLIRSFWYSLYSSLDGSAQIHLNDALINGPKLALQHWYGLGVGVAGFFSKRFDLTSLGIDKIHLESDHLPIMINVGLFGYLLFVLANIAPLFALNRLIARNKIPYSPIATAATLFFLSIFIGGLFFPLILSSRLNSYLQWIGLLLAFKSVQNSISKNASDVSPYQIPCPIN
jgi:hypothetical protein